jgi:cysteine synthase
VTTVGIGRTPPQWDASIVEGIAPVSTADAEAMARRLLARSAFSRARRQRIG